MRGDCGRLTHTQEQSLAKLCLEGELELRGASRFIGPPRSRAPVERAARSCINLRLSETNTR